MSAEKLSEVIDAIAQVVASSPEGSSKKPLVEDVKAFLEFEVTAELRDSAWNAYLDSVKEPAKQPEKPKAKAKGVTVIKNNHTQPMCIGGVVIPVNESREVSKFQPSPTAKRWLDKGVISIV